MFIADLHIHSKYSRATSRECVPEFLELWARRKGLDLIGTGDFTHPAWRAELKEKLASAEEGLYVLKKPFRKEDAAADGGLTPRFILSAEISSIYKKNGKVRKVHNLILLPCMEDAEALSRRLEAIGNLHSDGRPILGLDSRDLLQITLDVCPEAIFIPAHIWTPHFSLFGAYSGFDDIAECFEDLTGRIHALETGLSSDPPMNWRLSALDGFSLVSNSDAHSPANLAREANLFDTGLSYPHLSRALQNRHTGEFYGTLEFFPEEGKYHCDGHRNCKVCLRPAETKAVSGVCPVCGGRITVGVLHRVEALADRGEGFVLPGAKRFERLIPLHEVIAASMGRTTASVKVKARYDDLLRTLGPELFILRQASLSDIRQAAGILIAEGIDRLRRGKVEIRPGYDGEYGKIKILAKTEIDRLSGQLCFLPGGRGQGGAKPKETRAKREPAPKAVPVPADTQPRGGKPDAGQKPGEDAPYGLNREQWEAVSAGQPAVAVIAGPGTGKTKTLVSRIAYLIEKRGVQPSEIAAVTFTNKAAGEMRARLEKHFGNRRAVQAMTIGTFHSICLRVLSEHRGKISVPVIDQPDALSIVKDVLHTLGLKNPPRDVLRGISLRKNGEENPDIPPGVYELYQAQLAQYGVLDYDDILLEALALFENDARDDAEDRRRPASFSYILVDEFQDINALQYRLIWAWSANSAGIFVIGDPDQSIYGFRGADPRCFERFLNDYNPVRRVHLTQNYRSTPEILRCARSLMSEKTAVRHGLEARRESGPNVRLLDAEDAFAEALFVAKEINRMVGGMDMLDAQASKPAKGKGAAGHPRGFSDIAVLYRTNRQADILEQCLQKESIPYVVAGQDDFLMEAEVRGAVAFFRFLLDPGDLVSLRNCLKNAGVGQADIGRAMEGYAAAEKSVSGLARVLNGISGGRLPALVERLGKYEPLVCSEKPWKLMERWMEDDGPPESGCMEMLLNTSVMYDSMQSLLHNLVLGRESDLVRSGGRKYAPDAVSLMTLHGAKGLEFPAVFLCGVTEGLIPFQKRGGGCDMDEERRLFYVGMTRAKDELILLTSPAPSPFLAGLPPDALITGEALARRQAMPKQTSFLDV